MTPATPFGITVIAIWVLAQKFSYLSSSSIIELRLENVNEIIDWCIQCFNPTFKFTVPWYYFLM